jgi:DNA-binding response OmpR family regulator
MASILIAEDESRIASFVEKGLRAAGHTTAVAATGNDALEMALTDDFELLVLDIGLPGLNGFEVLEQLRGQGFTLPVIILTARDSVTDTVAGLDRGADDYMAKPFRIEELLARIRIRLRQNTSAEPSTLSHGDLSLDLHTRLASVGGRTIELSAREFSLLETLLRNAGQVMTREQLLSRVWGYDFDPGSNVVDVYIRYLRNKIGPDRILTVRGAGYRLIA